MDIKYNDTLSHERQLEEILLSDINPINKVRKLIAMGLDEEVAEEIVQSYQIGQSAPVYYERLDFDQDPDATPSTDYPKQR